jgi:hypothetical protein
MRKVFVAQHPTEAHLIRGVLEAEGIEARVLGDSLFSIRGATPITPETLPSVWVVDDADEARAHAVLRSGRDIEADRNLAWICPKCGERVAAHFGTCWNCGAEA